MDPRLTQEMESDPAQVTPRQILVGSTLAITWWNKGQDFWTIAPLGLFLQKWTSFCGVLTKHCDHLDTLCPLPIMFLDTREKG